MINRRTILTSVIVLLTFSSGLVYALSLNDVSSNIFDNFRNFFGRFGFQSSISGCPGGCCRTDTDCNTGAGEICGKSNGCCSPINAVGSGCQQSGSTSDCGGKTCCQPKGGGCKSNLDCCVDNCIGDICGGGGTGDCTVTKTYSCGGGGCACTKESTQESSASVTLKVSVDRSKCTGEVRVNYHRVNINCPNNPSCDGVCGNAGSDEILIIRADSPSASHTESCSPNCGTCQVDIDDWGDRAYQICMTTTTTTTTTATTTITSTTTTTTTTTTIEYVCCCWSWESGPSINPCNNCHSCTDPYPKSDCEAQTSPHLVCPVGGCNAPTLTTTTTTRPSTTSPSTTSLTTTTTITTTTTYLPGPCPCYPAESFYTGRYYYIFFWNCRDLVYEVSTDGITWTYAGVAVPWSHLKTSPDFSVYYDGTYVYLAYKQALSQIYFKRGSINLYKITWDPENAVTNWGVSGSNIKLVVSSNGKPWITANTVRYSSITQSLFYNSKGDGSGTWTSWILSNSDKKPDVTNLRAGKVYVTYYKDNQIKGRIYNSSGELSPEESVTDDIPKFSNIVEKASSSAIASNDNSYYTWLNQNNQIKYKERTQSWQKEIILDSQQAFDSYPDVTSDRSNTDSYNFWFSTDNKIKMKEKINSEWSDFERPFGEYFNQPKRWTLRTFTHVMNYTIGGTWCEKKSQKPNVFYYDQFDEVLVFNKTCSTGKTYCSGKCVDLKSDSINCGVCGKRCSKSCDTSSTCRRFTGKCSNSVCSTKWDNSCCSATGSFTKIFEAISILFKK